MTGEGPGAGQRWEVGQRAPAGFSKEKKTPCNPWFVYLSSAVCVCVCVCVCVKSLQSCLTLCDPMDCVAHQAPLSMRFSRQEYRGGLPCPPLWDLSDPGI